MSHKTMSSKYPSTLKGFGYAFNAAGQLRQIDPKDNSLTDRPYKFHISSDAIKNQANYKAIGRVISEDVYQMLLDAGLHKIVVPSSEPPHSSFVFGTKASFKNTKKLLILINGVGDARAGQWSQRMIINHSIDHGTQLPYIKKAVELGYDVLVTNINHNHRIENGKFIKLAGHATPKEHVISVWNALIAPVFETIESFAVVAHSYGGIVTLQLAERFYDAFVSKCFAIAFTDSVHHAERVPSTMIKWLHQNARNFVKSSKPLNEPVNLGPGDIPSYSAGHIDHVWTSWACIGALFPYLEDKHSGSIKFRLRKRTRAVKAQRDDPKIGRKKQKI